MSLLTRTTQISGVVFVLLISSKVHGAGNPPAISVPDGYTETVSYISGKYEQILMRGRCLDEKGEELDGPKETTPLLAGDSPKLKNVRVYGHKDKTIFESASLQKSKSGVAIAANEFGCSHYGFTLTLLTREKIDFKNSNSLWKFAAKAFGEFPFSKHGTEETNPFRKWLAGKKAPKCETVAPKTVCSEYADPNNYELGFEKDPKHPELTIVGFSYWYVM